jgi:hypothetical protein
MKKISMLTNENGSVIVLALIMLVLLTLLGMAVTRTSSIEVQVASNDQQATDCLYAAESADHYAIEASNGWLTNLFLTSGQLSAQVVIGSVDTDGDGIDDSVSFDTDGDGNDDVIYDLDGDGVNEMNFDIDGDGINDKIEIRCIEGTGGTHTGNLSAAANNLPKTDHISIPPMGSGYSLKYFEVRRYGITGTASNGCSQVQLGAYKVFNKF